MKDFFGKIGKFFKSLFVTVQPATEPKLKTLWKKEGTRNFTASLMAIFAGVIIGFVILLAYSLMSSSLNLKSGFEACRILVGGVFYTGRVNNNLTFGFNAVNIGDMLYRAMPLVLTGLSVAVAYKTGLFNIGASGQYLMGTWATLVIALILPYNFPEISTTLVWILSFLGGMAAGFIWGCIPGLFKALLNVNEVIMCIMTNWISIYLLHWFFTIDNQRGFVDNATLFVNTTESTKASCLYTTKRYGVTTFNFGLDSLLPNSKVSGGIIVAIFIAIVLYVVINKTTFGYELRACGSNRHGAKYAGMNDKLNIVLSMGIAGALSGAAASLYFLAGSSEYSWTNTAALPAEGFNGIVVALLANNNPIGCIFSATFLAYINIAGERIVSAGAYNKYISDIIVAVIVYLSSFALLFRNILKGEFGRREKKVESNNPVYKQQEVITDTSINKDSANAEKHSAEQLQLAKEDEE